MFTRSEFEIACKVLVENVNKEKNPHLKGWIWREHPHFAGIGCLERSTTTICSPQSNIAEDVRDEIHEEDAATLDAPPANIARVWQSIAYSVSFQMPVFYFSVHTDEGTPFSLPDIVDCTSLFLFQPHSVDAGDFEVTKYSIQAAGATLPLISQGEHPTLGTPCCYLHPCETQVALGELIGEDGQSPTAPRCAVEERGEEGRKLNGIARKLELWLLLVGNAVDLRT